ncbi:PREDICTED: zinc finger protein 658B-like, partial [Priapulus caudatus]|uniref:Zinc finger protein 658B-like n=1 Tax=Priapulus caudatus TaxID=37621 RepID=A0ABM1F9N2_PRICU
MPLHVRLKSPAPNTTKCRYCDLVPATRAEYNRHLATAHDVPAHECRDCRRRFRSQFALSKHACDSEPPPTSSSEENKCYLCAQVFASAAAVRTHVCSPEPRRGTASASVLVVLTQQCNFCEERFASKWALATHKCPYDDSLELNRCYICRDTFASAAAVAAHACVGPRNKRASAAAGALPEKHARRRPSAAEGRADVAEGATAAVTSPTDSQATEEASDDDDDDDDDDDAVAMGDDDERDAEGRSLPLVITGMRQVTEDSLWQCGRCGLIMTPEGQKHHACSDSVGMDADANYRCPKCAAAYTRRDNRNRHVWRNHLQAAYYSCDVCFRCCDSKPELEAHIADAHGIGVSPLLPPPPPAASATGVASGSGATRTQIECAVCYATCSSQHGLDVHMRRHSGEKPHRCAICSSTFTSGHNLTVHMRLHTGERPFTCELCGLTFTHRQSLKRHYNRHKMSSQSHNWQCALCKLEFVSPEALATHTRENHADSFLNNNSNASNIIVNNNNNNNNDDNN